MKMLVILALAATAGYFVWQKYGTAGGLTTSAVDAQKSAGANAVNRVDNLSGAAPSP